MPGPLQIFTFIIGSAVVIFGAYFATYLVARSSQKMYKGRAIQVVDRFSLSKDKSVVVLSIYGKAYVVAFAANSVTLLDTPDLEAVAMAAAQAPPAASIDTFYAVMKDTLKKGRKKEDQNNAVDKEDILK